MTYSALQIRDIHIFSDNFSRLLPRTLCQTPLPEKGKKRRQIKRADHLSALIHK